MQEQIDLERAQFGQEADQVFQRTSEPINAPRPNNVERAPRRVLAEGIERRPLIRPFAPLMP
jgi:hypothetical protein